MADSRHKHAAPKERTRRAFPTRVIAPAVGVLAIGGVIAGVVAQGAGSIDTTSPVRKDQFAAASVMSGTLPSKVSRSAERPPLPNVADVEDQIAGLRYAVTDLDIQASAKKSSPVLAKVASGDTVDITGKNKGDWAEIMHKGLPRWVKASGLAKEMPLGTSPCASGSASESGLQPDTIKVHRAVCAKFPSIVRYGGTAGRGEHATGQALDIMISSDLGNEVAAFLQEHRAELGIEYLIWRQRIWRPATSPNWRGMSSRGSATANHMDHVHVTTYGNSATG